MIRVVELFAGVGGFRLGLEAVHDTFDFVWMNQWEPGKKVQHAFDCYVSHFGISESHVNDDIAVAKVNIPDHDLIVGGFPCQDYSVARTNAKGIQGKKGVLWWEINDILKKHRPKYVLLENVDRLLKSPSSQRGRDFAVMLRCFFELGYYVEWRVVNAAEYGGAQRRRRIFIFAMRADSRWVSSISGLEPGSVLKETGFFCIPFTFDNLGTISNHFIDGGFFSDPWGISEYFTGDFSRAGYMLNGNIFTAEPELLNPESFPLRKVLIEGEVADKYYIGDEIGEWQYLKGAKRAPRKKPNGEEYFYTEGPIPFPDILDSPSRTILTSEASKNRSTHVIEDPNTKRLRFLTPEECERLNGFPDGWTDSGMPESWRYFVMGNALVVPLITKMGERIREIQHYEEN